MADLRKAFFDKLLEVAKKDEKVILITGDLGYSFIEKFQQELPKQYLNCGCMEQAMTGIGAGMALAGYKPYLYSGAIFILMRNYEQVRDDIAYNNLPVTIVGTKSSGFLGFTHNLQGTENVNDLLKNLPNIKAFYPETPEELSLAIEAEPTPKYIQL